MLSGEYCTYRQAQCSGCTSSKKHCRDTIVKTPPGVYCDGLVCVCLSVF